MMESGVLKMDEQMAVKLRSLYQTYGYLRYKMSKFEEYDFYAGNKDFLVSEGVITFTDTNGKLMALKPDVTLSIIKHCQEQAGYAQKVYYQENVYRISSGTHTYKEIMQAGLECIGDLDTYDLCEAVMLAAESLRVIADNWSLDVSHMGILAAVMDRYAVPQKTRKALMLCFRRKNSHEIDQICEELPEGAAEAMKALCGIYAPLQDGIARLKEICPEETAAMAELEAVSEVLAQTGRDRVFLNFSVVSDLKYYSGLVFNGFVEGLPGSVLSGGAYDNLMRKMGKEGGGIGFAVYLDQLERYGRSEKQYDVDTLLLYDADARPADIAGAVQLLMSAGNSVLAQRTIPENLRYRQLLKLNGKGVERVAANG